MTDLNRDWLFDLLCKEQEKLRTEQLKIINQLNNGNRDPNRKDDRVNDRPEN